QASHLHKCSKREVYLKRSLFNQVKFKARKFREKFAQAIDWPQSQRGYITRCKF
ncbi:Hypothetical predicted protein, partial [Paramuricea clavata]